jgi:hypothetical protein
MKINHNMAKLMTPHFIRQLVIHTICNVTGAPAKKVTALDKVELNTRDWEQVFSRLEATLDIQIGMLTSIERGLSIEALTHALHAKLADSIVP